MEDKKNILDVAIKAFEKFVKVFKKNGVLIVSYILLLFVIFYSFILNPINLNNIVNSIIEKNNKKTEEIIKTAEIKRIQADEILIPIMEDIAERPEVSRVLLFEKHNNSHNISGIDFLYLSSTYEAIDPSVIDLDYIGDYFQKQFVTNLLGSEIIQLLKHRDYLYYNNIENCIHPNHRLLHKLKKFDAKSLILIPFKNNENQPLLILAVISNKGEMDAPSIYNYIKPFENSIKQCLMK